MTLKRLTETDIEALAKEQQEQEPVRARRPTRKFKLPKPFKQGMLWQEGTEGASKWLEVPSCSFCKKPPRKIDGGYDIGGWIFFVEYEQPMRICPDCIATQKSRERNRRKRVRKRGKR